jgi:hypothetical protein
MDYLLKQECHHVILCYHSALTQTWHRHQGAVVSTRRSTDE